MNGDSIEPVPPGDPVDAKPAGAEDGAADEIAAPEPAGDVDTPEAELVEDDDGVVVEMLRRYYGPGG